MSRTSASPVARAAQLFALHARHATLADKVTQAQWADKYQEAQVRHPFRAIILCCPT